MAQIDIRTEKERDLTFIVISGKVTAADLVDTLKRFYDSDITSNILWDFSKSDVSDLVPGDLSTLVHVARRYAHLRPNGKSAFIASGEFALGVGSMYSSLSMLKSHTISNAIFRSMEEALDWLAS